MQDKDTPLVPPRERRWLRPNDAAALTGLAVATLNKLRVVGGGPPFIKIGRAVVYDADDLHGWMNGHARMTSTSS